MNFNCVPGCVFIVSLQRGQAAGGVGPGATLGPVLNNNGPANQFSHAVRGMPPAASQPPPRQPNNHYGDDHHLVTHQNGIIQLKLKDGIE